MTKPTRLVAYAALTAIAAIAAATPAAAQTVPVPGTIEVTGSATVNIVPDRITIEIGMEEYYRHSPSGDSVMVKLPKIEKGVRSALKDAGVPDSLIIVSDVGNYRDRAMSAAFLMARRLSATLSDFSQIDRIAAGLDRDGITSFTITRTDNSDMERYNREGLKAALDAARAKAAFIAENEGLTLGEPYEIVENGPVYYGTPAFSNVAYDTGAGMDNMRRIVRRYSVKARYLFKSPRKPFPQDGK